jgi:hypothetical protein
MKRHHQVPLFISLGMAAIVRAVIFTIEFMYVSSRVLVHVMKYGRMRLYLVVRIASAREAMKLYEAQAMERKRWE